MADLALPIRISLLNQLVYLCHPTPIWIYLEVLLFLDCLNDMIRRNLTETMQFHLWQLVRLLEWIFSLIRIHPYLDVRLPGVRRLRCRYFYHQLRMCLAMCWLQY